MATDVRAELDRLIAATREELRKLERARKQLADDPVKPRRRRSTQGSKR